MTLTILARRDFGAKWRYSPERQCHCSFTRSNSTCDVRRDPDIFSENITTVPTATLFCKNSLRCPTPIFFCEADLDFAIIALLPMAFQKHQTDESLLEAFHYINSVPGKDVRGTLIDCFQTWFKVDDAKIHLIKDIIGDLHNASLLIDDIEDNSKLRRGIPVAHKIFGIPTTINCANYVYFLALEKCQALDSPAAMQVFIGELLNLHRGQGYDILWRELVRCPTEEEYLAMVCDKTGGLFRLAVGLLQASATEHRDTDFTKLVNDLAMYFQIRDDFINVSDEEYMKSKSFCEDISEGKFSFPMVHAIRTDTHNQLISILKQRTEDVDVKRYAQSLMKDLGSLEYTRRKCSQLKQAIIEEVERFGGNAALIKVIEFLHVQLESMQTSKTTKEKELHSIDEP